MPQRGFEAVCRPQPDAPEGPANLCFSYWVDAFKGGRRLGSSPRLDTHLSTTLLHRRVDRCGKFVHAARK
ncbi:hypothetical protein J2Z50_004652 [Ensifer mexicanus]|nr:hypothetical protein [Sinorhizobium mexicanum]